MKKALVTGGAGFLGSHLCERLLNEGYQVLALDNLYTGSRENFETFAANPDLLFVEADVTEISAEDPRLAGPFDEIYNLACPASPPHYQARPTFTTLTSIKGVLLSLALAKRDGAKLLHASTSEIYGDPLKHPQQEPDWGNVNTIGVRSCYDEGKRVAETLIADAIRECDVDARMVRIFNTYGPRMHPQDGRVITNFITQALSGEDLTVYGDGSQTRSFQFFSDLIEAFRRYMELPKARVREFFAARGLGAPVLNTGNPGEFTVLELAQLTLAAVQSFRGASSSPSKIVFLPLPGDDPKRRRPDITLAKELLGWEPRVSLAEGLDAMVRSLGERMS